MSIINYISDNLCMETDDVVDFISTAPHRYKVYSIKKRNGKGFRVIAQPSFELKNLQRLVLNKVSLVLPVHDAALAYNKGRGIKDNAEIHKGSEYLLKMDFKDFFPSITSTDLNGLLQSANKFSDEDISLMKNLFLWSKNREEELRLSIGAPSSPFLSNALMYEFDTIMHRMCGDDGVLYTRYADDLSFSTNKKGTLFSIPDFVSNVCRSIEYPSLEVNNDKTVFSSKKHNRHITGLVISNDGKVSLGRKRKRYIKSLVFKYSRQELDLDKISHLKGLVAFAMDVEPEFVCALTYKYGSEVIREIQTI